MFSDEFMRDFFGMKAGQREAGQREICCQACGIVFAVPTAYADEREQSGTVLYCPNGHGLSIKAKP